MHQILVVGCTHRQQQDLARELGSLFELDFQQLPAAFGAEPRRYTVIDADLSNDAALLPLKSWLSRKPDHAKIIFVTDKASRLQEARASALGATAIVHRPVSGRMLLAKIRDDAAAHATTASVPHGDLSAGISAGLNTLETIFSAASAGARIDPAVVHGASNAIVHQLEAQGLSAWVHAVRMHHNQTYQHCLLVTGVAVGFGEHIGVSRKDRQRLSFAGMLHDIGKARIPLAILEKPGRLDENEMAIMRNHPEYGLEALNMAEGLPAEMLDMVVHHHELLDGTGYPHGLRANEISDLVRIMTISDIFGALIERRSYKQPLSSEAAYQILLDMGRKLDPDLVRAFKFAARVDQSAAVA